MARTRSLLGLMALALFGAACDQDPVTAAQLGPNRAEAQTEGGAAEGMARQGPGAGQPLAGILARADVLGLTDGQVASIQEIASRLAALNESLHDQLRETMPGTTLREEAMRDGVRPDREGRRVRMEEVRARMETVRPLMEQIRENNRAAMEEVRALLTPEQTDRLLAERRAPGQHRAEAMRERRGAGPFSGVPGRGSTGRGGR